MYGRQVYIQEEMCTRQKMKSWLQLLLDIRFPKILNQDTRKVIIYSVLPTELNINGRLPPSKFEASI